MGPRTLEARLTGRLLALAGGVLVAVGVASVAVTEHLLQAADIASARGSAEAGRDALERELAEGDAAKDAIEEVVAAAGAQGVRLAVRRAAPRSEQQGQSLPDLPAGACAPYTDDRGAPWLACASGPGTNKVVAAIPVAQHRYAIRALVRGMAAVIVAALLALWLLARRTVRRSLLELTALVHWSGRIVENQQAVDPPPTTTHEIAQLEAAFDALVRRLLDALARERANSAHIAHELRTPLTSIAAELDSIHVPGDAAQAAIARVRADVMRLADVIEAILVLSASRSEMRRDDAVVNVADIARDLAPASAKIQAPDEALVHGDERLVALALRNLVENAGRYGTGVDCVRVTREGDAVRIAVVDRGPGLDESARRRMFDRYWRGGADGEGKGLGLALVRAVAERHEGSVDARPGADGRGLQVSLTLGGLIGWHEEAATSG